MRPHIDGIDHVVILVHDLDRAQDTYSRLGFKLTPRGFHSLGSQNHCMMFGHDYVELLAVPKPHPVMQNFTDFLARSEGLAALALASTDARALHAGLVASGIAADAPLDFARPVEMPDGARDAAFRIVQLPKAVTPGCLSFVCQHFNRDLVWQPPLQSHPLGVTGIAAIAVTASTVATTARAYSRVLGSEPQAIAEGWLLATGGAPVAVCDTRRLRARLQGAALPARAAPMVAALFLRVRDRNVAADVLRDGGFEPQWLGDGSFAISADQAHGVALVFG